LRFKYTNNKRRYRKTIDITMKAKSFHFCPRCGKFSFFKRHMCNKCDFRVLCWFKGENSYQFYIQKYLISCDCNTNQTSIYSPRISRSNGYERICINNFLLSPKLTEEDLRKLLILV
jgi:ribosomal protein L32